MLNQNHQRGDTIIEVILAFAVFAALAVGTIALMNRGTQAAQQALESTLTQQAMAAQSEALRYLRESYIADPSATGPAETFKNLIGRGDDPAADSKIVTAPTLVNRETCTDTAELPADAFAVNTADASIIPVAAMDDADAPAYPQIVTTGATTKSYGLWIEAVQSSAAAALNPTFIDFYVHACWFSPASSGATKTGTIVRQYIP